MDFSSKIAERFKHLKRVKATSLVFAGALFPLAEIFYFGENFSASSPAQVAGGVIIIIFHIVALAGAYFIDDDSIEEIVENVSLREKVADYQQYLVGAENVARVKEFILRSFSGAVQDIRAGRPSFTNQWQEFEQLKPIIAYIMEAVAADRRELFEFDAADLWNFAVYVPEKNEELTLFWRQMNPIGKRSDRSWPPGQGHVGQCYQQNKLFLSPDADADDNLKPKEGLQRAHDADQYKSIIAVPIRLADPNKLGPELSEADAEQFRHPYGVLVATSNKTGQFNETHTEIFEFLAQLITSVLHLSDSFKKRIY